MATQEKTRFGEFHWLEDIIEALFKCLSILAEPFLAFGLVASGIDYGMHGKFLANVAVMQSWTVTQGIALEGSGGVALALSFEAAAEGDQVKAWCQRLLAIALLLTGGIMFYVEISQGALGGNASTMPDWYVHLMSALRAVVSIGYIAMCRTKKHRFSGTAPEIVQMQSMQEAVQSAMQGMQGKVQSALHAEITKMHGAMQTALTAQLAEIVQSQVAGLRTELVGIVQSAVEQDIASAVAVIEEDMQQLATARMGDIHQALSSDVHRICSEILHSVRVTEVPSVQAALNAPQRSVVLTREPRTDALPSVQSAEDSVQQADDAASSRYKAAIFAYVQSQCMQGHEPTAQEIVNAVQCGQRTAFKYRKPALKHALMLQDVK